MWSIFTVRRLASAAENEVAKAANQAAKTTKPSREKRMTMAERVLMERRVMRISQISDTAEARVRKQISTRTAHRVLPLSHTDQSTDEVCRLARQVLLHQRARTRATWTDKQGLPKLTPVNGMGHFVLPLTRIHLQYCSHAGDAVGIREFLSHHLYQLAKANPSVEFVVEPRWGRFPLMRAHYLQGNSKAVCARNLTANECLEMFMKLRNSSGQTLRPFHPQVKSSTPAVRPIWSPFHMKDVNGKNDLLRFLHAPREKLQSTTVASLN